MAEINTIWKINYTLQEMKKKIEVACPEIVLRKMLTLESANF